MNKQREVVYGYRNEVHRHRGPAPAHLRGHRRSGPRRRSPNSSAPARASRAGLRRRSQLGEHHLPPRAHPRRSRSSRARLRRGQHRVPRRADQDVPTNGSARTRTPTPLASLERYVHPQRHRPSLAGASLRDGRPARGRLSARLRRRRIRSSNTRPRRTTMFVELMDNIKNEVLQQSLPQHHRTSRPSKISSPAFLSTSARRPPLPHLRPRPNRLREKWTPPASSADAPRPPKIPGNSPSTCPPAGPRRRSDATNPAPAAAEKNTRPAADGSPDARARRCFAGAARLGVPGLYSSTCNWTGFDASAKSGPSARRQTVRM